MKLYIVVMIVMGVYAGHTPHFFDQYFVGECERIARQANKAYGDHTAANPILLRDSYGVRFECRGYTLGDLPANRDPM